MELICIDANFSQETVDNVPHLPTEGHIDTVRAVRRNPDGSYGVLLENIVNPIIKVPTEWGFSVLMEPNFHPRRFRNLDNSVLTAEMLDEIFQPIKKDQYA